MADTFTIASLGGETLLANSSVTVTTPISGTSVNLMVTKHDNGGAHLDEHGNTEIDYTIIISNTGNQATTVVITETVPDYMELNLFASGWDCNPSRSAGSTCVNNAGVLTPGETIDIPFPTNVSGSLLEDAVLTITDNDAASNLSVVKTVTATDPAAVQPGEAISYTIVVANNGSDALGVLVSDSLPAHINGADLNQTVDIAANDSVTFTIPATVANDVPPGVTITNTASFNHVSGSGQATAAITIDETVSLTEPIIYLSSDRNGRVNDLRFADEDILAYDPNNDSWSKYFDGSDVGLWGTDLDAFYLLDDGSILFSLDRPKFLPGLGWVDDSDIVRFVPTALGENSAGSFEWYFDGSDVGLFWGSEDVDTISFTPEGNLIISTIGPFAVLWVGGRDEDLIVFIPTSLGRHTRSSWERYFDGSDVGLRRNSEDVRGTWIDPANSDIYLTTKGNFSVDGLSGDGADMFICHPISLGASTSCTFSFYWDGSAHGLTRGAIDAFTIVSSSGNRQRVGRN